MPKKPIQHQNRFARIYKHIKVVIYTIITIFLLASTMALGIGIGFFASLVDSTPIPTKTEMSETMHRAAQKSTLTYANGQQIAEIHSDILRTNVSANEISPNVIDALTAVEDPDFFTHKGITPKSIIRAGFVNLTNKGAMSGGSTLTQQLVKQQFLSDDQTMSRKAKELLLAMRLEKYFSKKDIITTYLNISSFGRNNQGQNIAGIEEAALGIFGKKASDLNVPQAAFLAGLPQSPIVYSPYTSTGELKDEADLKYGLDRKNVVLESMYRNKFLTKKEYEDAKNYDLKKDFLAPSHDNADNDSYLYYAAQSEAITKLMPILYQKDGYTAEQINQDDKKYSQYYQLAEKKLSTGGYTIKTTIDENIYNQMQKMVSQYGSLFNENNGKQIQVGNVLMDNATGKIYGFISGRDYSKNQNDHAFTTKRSPASTMKPIIAYAPAIDIGLVNSRTMLND